MILLGQWSWCPSPPAWGRPFYSALLPAPARWFWHLITWSWSLWVWRLTFIIDDTWPGPSYLGRLTVLLRSDCMPAQLALVSLSLGRFWSEIIPLSILVWAKFHTSFDFSKYCLAFLRIRTWSQFLDFCELYEFQISLQKFFSPLFREYNPDWTGFAGGRGFSRLN